MPPLKVTGKTDFLLHGQGFVPRRVHQTIQALDIRKSLGFALEVHELFSRLLFGV